MLFVYNNYYLLYIYYVYYVCVFDAVCSCLQLYYLSSNAIRSGCEVGGEGKKQGHSFVSRRSDIE